MLAGKTVKRRKALRASIQMGGASRSNTQILEDLAQAVAFLLSDEDTLDLILFLLKEKAPRSGIAERRRRRIVEEIKDGDHGEDGR